MHIIRGNEEYTVMQGDEWFWKIFADGTWEPSTFKIFDQFLKSDETFLDIGAWIGPTALYASKRAKKVFAFEPDPVAYEKLCQNLNLNDTKNVVPYPVAVSDQWKGMDFGIRTGLGDSMSSELWGRGGNFQVPAISFKSVVMDLKPNFIKIDIEGGEANLLKGSKIVLDHYKPTIHLSLHTPWHIDDLEDFASEITAELSGYPYFYDENLNPVEIEAVFDTQAFNAIVATHTPV